VRQKIVLISVQFMIFPTIITSFFPQEEVCRVLLHFRDI